MSSPFQIITVEEAKRRKSTCSYYEEDDEVALPVLQPHSALLENMHIEQVGAPLGHRAGLPGLKKAFSIPDCICSSHWG